MEELLSKVTDYCANLKGNLLSIYGHSHLQELLFQVQHGYIEDIYSYKYTSDAIDFLNETMLKYKDDKTLELLCKIGLRDGHEYLNGIIKDMLEKTEYIIESLEKELEVEGNV